MSEDNRQQQKNTFEVEYTPTKALYEHFYKRCAMKINKIVGIVLIVVGIAMLAVAFLSDSGLLHQGPDTKQKLLYIILAAAEVCVGVFLTKTYKIMGGVAMNNMVKEFGEAPATDILIKDRIYIRRGERKPYAYDYGDIMLFVETDRIFALMITKQMGVILPKDSFTDGEPSEFAEFFKQKCVRTCGFRRG
ncbi:MAG: YcxB family protein [Eubacteriaceae bacterium]|jgi:hypothetical protein|nr:YcxB family protein [Eubacteriaceae bacterium]